CSFKYYEDDDGYYFSDW
nr:immunoglobulin heavy chain junction region [Macaca mulatta]